MNDTRFDTRSSEWIGDMTVWLRENSADNSGCGGICARPGSGS